MAKIKVRYLLARRQKGHILYYWYPTKLLREAGFLPRRLAESTNNLADAVREAEALNAELDAWRMGLINDGTPRHGTMPWLVREYRKSVRYLRLRENSRLDYEQAIKQILDWSKRAGDPHVSAIRARDVEAFYQARQKKAPGRAGKVVAILRAILSYGVKDGVITSNPASNPDVFTRSGRDVVWSHDEVAAFCEAATQADRASLALATLLAVNLGQRQGDILSLAWNQYDGAAITLRQRKTGRLLIVPVTSDLKTALDNAPRKSPTVVIAETTGQPYKRHYFSHEFRRIARLAKIRPELQFLDLRRTVVVDLAEAGASDIQIGSVTGHSYDRSKKILETYLPRRKAVAETAISLLDEHRKRT